MATSISTLRPGLLVSLKSSLSGNVSYRTVDLESDHLTAEGVRRAKWETERVISDPVEHEEAVKVRGKARSLITACCAPSSFGLLCPEARRESLTEAIDAAHDLVDSFNRRAVVTRIGVYVIVGRVAQDDAEAIRAINSEMTDLLQTMESGLRALDVQVVRDAANKARAISSMLTPEAARQTGYAIEAARSAARKIVKAAEAGAAEIDLAAIKRVRSARSAFIDLDEAADMAAPSTSGRAIDFDPAPAAGLSAAPGGGFNFALEF